MSIFVKVGAGTIGIRNDIPVISARDYFDGPRDTLDGSSDNLQGPGDIFSGPTDVL